MKKEYKLRENEKLKPWIERLMATIRSPRTSDEEATEIVSEISYQSYVRGSDMAKRLNEKFKNI